VFFHKIGDGNIKEIEIILDNLPIGILYLNNKGDMVYKNSVIDEIDEDTLSKIIEENRDLYKERNKYFRVRKIIVKDGGIITVEDVTEKIVAENVLKESEEKYRAVCENSLIGIAILKKNEVLYINKKFERILGYKGEKLKKKFFDLMHPDDVEKFNDIFKEKMAQIRMFDKNNNIRWLEIGCSKIKYDGKSYLINAMDITRRKEMEIEIKKANEKMHKALERERKFLEEISHYFFNPLCIAKGYLDLSIPNADPSMKRKLEITKEAITRVENVVKHIVIEGKIYE